MPTAYKLFRISKKNKGCLFPLYVNAEKPTPLHQWLEAECGEMINGKVKSRLGLLAYRPAWHLSDLPLATHIGVKDESGRIAYQHSDSVWAECSYSDAVDYQPEADKRGFVNGRFDSRKAYLDYIPHNGFYRYKTSPTMTGNWILAGEIMVNRVLTDNEVNDILFANHITPMPRYGGELLLSDYGF